MRKMQDDLGQTYWEPTDPNDAALLKVAEGAIFGETTFPSGWVSPAGKQVAKNGKLYKFT